ncbi:TauD/TfdA dioxygenase family protein [Lysobacter sp. CA199]|uniref:TauD/TfdA dioxygenase family protein n=1 Tax=Lysobacter sp. CA199 TaxID=3455608 RepID=UPI003F8D495C
MSRVDSPKVGFDLAPLGRFGAEVSGIDLREALDESTMAQLRRALAEHQILVIRGQSLPPADQTRFARCFGESEPGIARRPEGHQVAGHPNILYLSNRPGSPTMDYGVAWHSDGLAYARVPHGITMLHCIACPPGVGATLFANQYLAYQAMSAGFRKLVRDLYWYLPPIPFSEVPPGKGLAQPMVRAHPVTGREFVFCSPSARQIRGLSRQESEGLLKVVHEYQVREELVYRHQWRELDVVLWENCALLHNRDDVVDYASQGLRAMHRAATSGTFAAIECEAAED